MVYEGVRRERGGGVQERSQKMRWGEGRESLKESVDRDRLSGFVFLMGFIKSTTYFTQNSDDTFSFLESHIGPIGDSW